MVRRKLLNQLIESYHRWLHSSIHQQTNSCQPTLNPLRLQRPSKGFSPGLLTKKHNRKSKVSWVLQTSAFSSTTQSKMETSHRPKKTKHLLEGGEIQNGNTRVPKDLSDSSRMDLLNRTLRCLSPHSHLPRLKRILKVHQPSQN